MLGTFAEFERVWISAVEQRDVHSLDVLLDDEFMCTSWASSGELITKQQYLLAVQQEQITNCQAHDFNVQQADDTVIVKCRMTCEFADRGLCSELLVTDTWVRRSDRWKVLARHTSLQYGAAENLGRKRKAG